MQCASPRLAPFRFRAWLWSSMHCCTWQSRLLSPYPASPIVIYEVGKLASTLPDVDKGANSNLSVSLFKNAPRVVSCVRPESPFAQDTVVSLESQPHFAGSRKAE